MSRVKGAVVGFRKSGSVKTSEAGLPGRKWISVPALSHLRRSAFTLPARSHGTLHRCPYR